LSTRLIVFDLDGTLVDSRRDLADSANALLAACGAAALSEETIGRMVGDGAATRRVLAGLDLARHFPDAMVVGGDGPFARKPDPSGLQHLIATAGVTAGDTVLVGDSVIDWRTARNAATRVYLAGYGFGFEGVPLDQLKDGEVIVNCPAELRAML